MGRRVALDEECCIGCGSCAELCPDVFQMTEDGEKARVIVPECWDEECVQDAIATCPGECISIEN
jgi:ferredoxin